jgi:putative N6-adenine-specific DNA methylase
MTRSSSPKSRIVITCAKGVPPFLKEEISSLGLPVRSESVAGVETEGTMEEAMRLNLFLRTGQRVLLLLRELEAKNADEIVLSYPNDKRYLKYLLFLPIDEPS